MFRWVRRNVGGQAAFDSGSWFLAVFFAGLLRYEFDQTALDIWAFAQLALGLSLGNFSVGKALSLYRGRYRVGSYEELLLLAVVTVSVTAPITLAVILFGSSWDIPRSIVLIATPFFLVLAGGARAFRRFLASRSNLAPGRKRALVYGAGQMAEFLIPQLRANADSPYQVVGLLDDDPRKKNRWISGAKMMGSLKDLGSATRESKAEALIVAIPRIDSSTLEVVYEAANRASLEVAIMPTFSEALRAGETGVALRKLTIEDLVGRRAVKIEDDQISTYLQNKTVLVTGAGGSIGIELCRQVAGYLPKELVFLDRDETGLQLAQLAIENSGLLDTPNAVLADIRDEESIRRIFNRWKPEVVFHAAALKHLPVLERHPSEAWKTNVIGTLNVLKAASENSVQAFINISTDKAADPSSVLGKSKKLAEQLTAWMGNRYEGSFISVRFGNVLGSRGSLVPTVAHMIESGGPVTVTHAEATRYFMTIPEACQLVLQSGVLGGSGVVYVLDMGDPVRVVDVIKRMIQMSGRSIDLVETGLRPGEKLHEVLLSSGNSLEPTEHPLISRVSIDSVSPSELPRLEDTFS